MPKYAYAKLTRIETRHFNWRFIPQQKKPVSSPPTTNQFKKRTSNSVERIEIRHSEIQKSRRQNPHGTKSGLVDKNRGSFTTAVNSGSHKSSPLNQINSPKQPEIHHVRRKYYKYGSIKKDTQRDTHRTATVSCFKATTVRHFV
uniref:Uncharacterized protein n=1 Tax=Caenorhabditis japonica TaxID=281687 RepID=A0A8R1IRG4_CAEJA